jgi:hypothetical protein
VLNQSTETDAVFHALSDPTRRLVVKRLDTVQDWIDERRRTWERRLDRLGDYLDQQARTEQPHKEQS